MSPPRRFDPRRLDVAAFAGATDHLAGEWPLAAMHRLMRDAVPLAADSPAQTVAWTARGERSAVAGGEHAIRLHLSANTVLQLTCQRCLQPLTVVLEVQSTIRFVRGEEQAERLDEECDEDVLALPASLDLQDLIEDELILALPLVPRHEVCPQPLPMSAADTDAAEDVGAERLFAGLASLLRDSGKKPS